MDAMTPEAAELIKPSPPAVLRAPTRRDPEDWGTLIAKTSDAIKHDYDWTDEVRGLKPRTLLVFADADSIRPDHIAEFYGLLGGGLRRRRLGRLATSRPTSWRSCPARTPLRHPRRRRCWRRWSPGSFSPARRSRGRGSAARCG